MKKPWFWPLTALMIYALYAGTIWYASKARASSSTLSRSTVVEALTEIGFRNDGVVQFRGRMYRLENVWVGENRPGDFTIHFRVRPN